MIKELVTLITLACNLLFEFIINVKNSAYKAAVDGVQFDIESYVVE